VFVVGYLETYFKEKKKTIRALQEFHRNKEVGKSKSYLFLLSEVYMIFGVFAGEIFRGLDMFYHSSDLHGGIFGPRCFVYQQILTPVKLGKSAQQKKCFGVQGPRRLFLRRGKICGV